MIKRLLVGLMQWICVATLLGQESLASAVKTSARRFNVLLLVDDQHRGDWLGAAGASWMITPNLDLLAHEGVLFRRAYTSTPSCLPARAALLTGMSPWGHGCLGYVKIPAHYQFEKPRVFTEAGWRTYVVGKNHYDPPDNLHGYETGALGDSNSTSTNYWEWFLAQAPGRKPNQGSRSSNDQRGGIIYPFAEELHRTTWTTARALEFLEGYKQDRPWFLKISFCIRIRPSILWRAGCSATKGWISPQISSVNGHGKTGEIFTGRCSMTPTRSVVSSRSANCRPCADPMPRRFLRWTIGRILAAVEKRGELENTFILFTSDHGDMMGDHLLYRKTYPYEGSVRVPMILRWPSSLRLDARRGQLREELTELRDVLPTLLDAAGLPKPAAVEGMSLLDILRGKPGRTRLDLEHASCYQPKDGWVALMDQRFKYIYFVHTGQQQLFDLQQDPNELQDLAGQPRHATLVKELREKMRVHLQVRGEPWVRNGDLAIQNKAVKRRTNNPNVRE